MLRKGLISLVFLSRAHQAAFTRSDTIKDSGQMDVSPRRGMGNGGREHELTAGDLWHWCPTMGILSGAKTSPWCFPKGRAGGLPVAAWVCLSWKSLTQGKPGTASVEDPI